MRWDELNANLLEALRLEKTVVMVVTLLVMLMASLNLFGFVFLFLLSRRRDFQILGELGLSPRDHHQILAWVSAALGGVASLCSLVAGFFVLVFLKFGPGIPLNPDVYFVSRVPVEFDFWWLGSFWFLNLFLAATAGFAVALHMGQRMKLRDQ